MKHGYCINCRKYKAKFIIKWTRKDGRIGRQWKRDSDHKTCQKCWRAIKNQHRVYNDNT